MRPKTVKGVYIDHTHAMLDVEKLVWRPGVYALILDEAQQILVLDNPAHGRYELPGGGAELWEPLRETLIREVWEETGLDVEVGSLIHAEDAFYLTPGGSHWHTLLHFYTAHITGGEIRSTILEDETCTNPHWVDPRTLGPDDLVIGWAAIQKIIKPTGI